MIADKLSKGINKGKQCLALFFITIFITTLLMKPLHFLFLDHNHIQTEEDTKHFHSEVGHDCEICLFTFHFFIPQQFTGVVQFIDTFFIEINIEEVFSLSSRLISLISSRAPPYYLT